MDGYRGRRDLMVLWKMLVQDVLAALARDDPGEIASDSPARTLEYDPVARRIVRRLMRDEAMSLEASSAIVTEEIRRLLGVDASHDRAEAAASAIWNRWQEILVLDRTMARLREWREAQ